jgi:hypothetical protein
MATNNSSNFGTGTTGQILTSTGSGSAPTFQGAAQQPGHPYAVGTSLVSGFSAVCIPWVSANPGGSLTGTSALATVSIYLVPIYIDEAITYTKIGCQVTGTPGVGSKVDMVIYNNSGTGNLPGTVLATAVNVSSESAGLAEGTISFSPTPGYHWLGIQRNATANVSVKGTSNSDSFSFFTNRAIISLGSPTNAIQVLTFLGATNTYGTYNNNPTITSNAPANSVPLIYLR